VKLPALQATTTPDRQRSRHLREKNVWFTNAPATAFETHTQNCPA
jgi:hypothetical protein